MKVSKILRKARREKEVSQEKLAQFFGFKRSAISAWELEVNDIKAQQFIDALHFLGKKIVIKEKNEK